MIFKPEVASYVVWQFKYFCLKTNIPEGNYWIFRIGVMGSCQKVPKFDFQSQFFFNSILEHIFCYWHFLIASIFKSLYLLKWCSIFDTSPLTQFSKFNNFLWVCWFLGKNLSNFVPPVWKLHNPYCHSLEHLLFFLSDNRMIDQWKTLTFCFNFSQLQLRSELSNAKLFYD